MLDYELFGSFGLVELQEALKKIGKNGYRVVQLLKSEPDAEGREQFLVLCEIELVE